MELYKIGHCGVLVDSISCVLHAANELDSGFIMAVVKLPVIAVAVLPDPRHFRGRNVRWGEAVQCAGRRARQGCMDERCM